jgi:ribosomal protein S18 acetylase RimI-like enzyme
MIIRKAKSSDLEYVAEIYKKAYSERPYLEKWNKGMLVKKLKEDSKTTEIYVADTDKRVVGFIMFSIYDWYNGKWAYIEDFAILKEYRGMGLGKSLMERVETDCKNAHVKRILLDVYKKANAINLYTELGYKENGYVTMEKKLR